MEIALTLVTLLAIAVAASSFAERYSIATPLLLMVVGFGASYVSFLPQFELTPEIVLVGLLPPLLYAASIKTSLVDFAKNRRPILLLSVGLVIFTTVGVGAIAHALLPISWPVAFALGAVVAPPDAVAASAVARKVGMPRRVVTILEGESLVNDATAIVTLRAAIAAMGGTVHAWEVGLGFVVSAVGGIAVGLVVAMIVGQIRWRLDTLSDVAVSLITPWVAYIGAEEIHPPGVDAHPSGVLAIVTTGLLLGHKSQYAQSASSRLFERTNWATISYVLENAVFLLIGLQVRDVVNAMNADDLSNERILGAGLAVLGAVIVLRLVWVYPATYVPRWIPAIRRADPPPPLRIATIVGWAGMRGVVTLAAAFLLPEDTPHRAALVAIAFIVTVGTLLLQGLTLPTFVRLLNVRGPDRQEDHLEEANIMQAAVRAGMDHLDQHVVGTVSDDVLERLRQRATDRANAVWERLGGADTPTAQYSRARAAMIQAERAEVLQIRRRGNVDQSVVQRVLDALDVEESILDRLAEDESTAERETELKAVQGACDHLTDATCRVMPEPRTPAGCEECLADGSSWVHLRLCLECGHVGCCDSSPNQHATAHFHGTGHPVIRSFEPGEAWRWCYVDEVTG